MGAIEDFVMVGYGSGYGSGIGSGYGSGSGIGIGDGYGIGSGSGSGYGIGSGYGDGYGYGYGDGYGSGSGDGSGSGSGYGDGSGSGSGSGYGVKSVNNKVVYHIDDIPTIIETVKGNVAKGFILLADLSLRPCFVVKCQNKFAHGETLHQAFSDLQEKLYSDYPIGSRIEKFIQEFPNLNKKIPARELFSWHHILTGSCKAGRQSFCYDRGINIDTDLFTVTEFINMTINAYNGEIIMQLKNKYETNDLQTQ